MGDVTVLHGYTNLDIPPERVLEGASQCCPVVVVGRGADGDLHFASSTTDAWSVHTLLTRALRQLERDTEPHWQEMKKDRDNG